MAKIKFKYGLISEEGINLTETNYIGHNGKNLKDFLDNVPTLDESGKVPSSQLPSYVDDVLEYSGKSKFPAQGESGKIYVDTETELTYRWSGTTYVEISPSIALGETSTTAYPGNKGKQTTDNLATHIADNVRHITAAEREKWNTPDLELGETSTTAYPGNKGKQTTDNLATHVSDNVRHITAEEREKWNSGAINVAKVANVKDFGAVGDGETNDSSAVKRAISYAKTNKCPLYFPVGTYIIDCFTLWDDAVIYGENMNTTILKQLNTFSGSFIISVWNSAQSKHEITNNVTIKDLTLDGYGNTTTGRGTGLVYYGFRLYLENLTVRGFNNVGISVNRPDEDFAGKHGHMKDIILYDNKGGNMLYDGETDNNFYNIMAYHNEGIEPQFNVQMKSAGCRAFGMHLWGLADVSLLSDCFGATYTGCHIEGGKSAKIAVYNRMQFFGRIYHHNNDPNNDVPAIKAMNSLFNSTFVIEGNNIHTLVDFNNKWVSNVYMQADVEMTSDNLFKNGSFGINDNAYINWNYNNNRYVWAIDKKRKIDTYNNIDSVMQNVNEVHYNADGARTFAINAGDENSNAYVSTVPGVGNAQISASSTTENDVDLRLMPKGNGTVEIGHKCINGANYDDFDKTGFYEALGSTTTPTVNAPNGSDTNNNFYVLVQRRSDDYISQTAFSVRADMLVYQRNCSNGVWSEWTRYVKGSDITIVDNGPEWHGESYARIYQYPKDDIYLATPRMRYTIGNSPIDLNDLVDTTVDYYNWNGVPTSANYPAHTPADMIVSPFHMKVTHTRPDVIVQELTPDDARLVGATYYRRGVGKGTEDSPYVWEEWTASQNTVPMSRLNYLGVDYNSLTTAGMYIAQGSSANPTQNSPDGNDANNNYVVIVGNPGKYTTYLTQTAYSVRSDARIFHRTCSGGVWSAWKRVATQDDITALMELVEE